MTMPPPVADDARRLACTGAWSLHNAFLKYRVSQWRVALLIAVVGWPGFVGGTRASLAPEWAGYSAPPFEVVGQLGGLVTALVPDGDRLYLGVGSRLLVLDVSTPSGVPEGGDVSVGLPYSIKDAALLSRGLIAVLAGDVVCLVDVTEPGLPLIASTYDQGQRLRAIEARQGTVFALGDDSVYVLSAWESGQAALAATIDLPMPAKSNTKMVVGDGVMFIGGGVGSLLVYDVTMAAAPALIGGVEDSPELSMMVASGRTMYALVGGDVFDDEGNRLAGVVAYVVEVVAGNRVVTHGLVDLVKPRPAPGEFMAVAMAIDAPSLCASGAVGAGGGAESRQVRCWDIGEAERAAEVSRVAVAGLGATVRMATQQGRLYLAANDVRPTPGGYQSPAVAVADVSSHEAAAWLGVWQLDGLGGVQLVVASERHVAMNEYAGLTHLYGSPYEVGDERSGYIDASAAHGINQMRLDGDRLVTIGLRGLALFDLSDRSRPVLQAEAPVGTRLPVLATSGPRVYATMCDEYRPEDREEGCAITAYDMKGVEPDEFIELSVMPVGLTVRSIAVAGTYLLAVVLRDDSLGREVLSVYDYRDPRFPIHVADVDVGAGVKAKSIVIRDNFAFVSVFKDASGDGRASTGLRILDVSDAARSRVVGEFDVLTDSRDLDFGFTNQYYPVALVDRYALFAGNERLVHVVDVGRPGEPREVQRIEVEDVVTDLDAAARHAYVVRKGGGLAVLRSTYPGASQMGVSYLPIAEGS